MVRSSQSTLSTFVGASKKAHKSRARPKRKRSEFVSAFATCPICLAQLPKYRLKQHASSCNGREQESQSSKTPLVEFLQPSSEPFPGLQVFENFISEQEENMILSCLDGTDPQFASEFLPWKPSSFNGKHHGKRWGVHCNLRERKVTPEEHPLPTFLRIVVLPRLCQRVRAMKGCVPNEANAIDYRPNDYLKAHVDDRRLSKEPIANLSLAGDCIMTFRNERNGGATVHRGHLPRRCLQVLTGPARYDFSHGIDAEDILSQRRVSVTMRESPLTTQLK